MNRDVYNISLVCLGAETSEKPMSLAGVIRVCTSNPLLAGVMP